MEPAKRVIVNTMAQYVKTIVNVLLSMYSTRLVLSLLGSVDYGIYSLVASVVAMLSFLSNAIVVSTQRFLSFYQGRGDRQKLKKIFNDSIILHLILGLAIAAILAGCTPLLFNGFLDIPNDRLPVAKEVYFVVVGMLLVTFLTSPFKASLISHEDIVYISIVDVIDGVLKVALVILLSHLSVDKLIGYALLLLGVQLFNFAAFTIFSIWRYEECKIRRLHKPSGSYFRELASFAGWTIYSNGCIIGRTQGFAILLDKFIGVVSNAAFGIAQQVSGFASFVSESLLNAVRPQIMKAEGEGKREYMLLLSCEASKIALLLLGAVVLPVMFFLDPLLSFWLTEVPKDTAFFCRMVLLAAMMDSTTIGLATANQAIGRIRNYSLGVNTTKLLTLPLILVCMKAGVPLMWSAVCYVGIELLSAIIRIPFLSVHDGPKASDYLKTVIVPVIPPLVVYTAVLFVCRDVFGWGVIVSGCVCLCIYAVLVACISLDREERQLICSFFKRKK